MMKRMQHPSRNLFRSPVRRPANAAGFSLIELMVSMTLLSVVIVGVLAILFNIQRSWTSTSEQMEASQNERVSVDLMANDIRMAGSGWGGMPAVTPGVPAGRVYALEPRPGQGAPDTLYVTGCMDGATAATTTRMLTAATDIVVTDVSQFAVNDLVIVSGSSDASLFQVTGINTATQTLEHSASSPYNDTVGHTPWPNGGFPISSRVARVTRVAYWIEEDGDTGLKTLMRKEGSDNPVAVADNVSWMRLSYVTSTGITSSAPADPAVIRTVLLDYVSPALSGDLSGHADTLSMRIQPRVLS